MEQGSPEWFAERCGKVTASRVADVMAKTKTGYSTSRNNYAAELICERLTGVTADRYSNAAMQWGTDNESSAKAAYMFMSDATIEDVGFVSHGSIVDFGASPDGLIETDGMIEIKCPNTATHIETLMGSSVEGRYITQMQSQMACTGRQWCDYVSFDPRMPVDMQLFIKRITRDDTHIAEIEKEVSAFIIELAAKIHRLEQAYGRLAA